MPKPGKPARKPGKSPSIFLVKLFGPLADAAQTPVLHISVPAAADMNAARLMGHIADTHPALAHLLGNARLAVNCGFVTPDHPVSTSDELALIGMVSGG